MKRFLVYIIFSTLFAFKAFATLDAPDVEYVSINPFTNEVIIQWTPSTSSNIEYTRLSYVYDETTIIKARTIVDIKGNTETNFKFKTDTMSIFLSEANEAPLSFAADAFADNGDNTVTLVEYHTTMHTDISYTKCTDFIYINWTAYSGFQTTVNSYDIIEVFEDNSTSVIETVPSSDLSVKIAVNTSFKRRFYIKANLQSTVNSKIFESTSNMIFVEFPNKTKPTYINFENISIIDSAINLQFSLDPLNEYNTYTLQKSSTEAGTFTDIEEFNVSVGQDSYSKTLTLDNSQSRSFYRLIAKDDCKDSIFSSAAISHSIITKVIELKSGYHDIHFNISNIWNKNFNSIEIQRITDGINFETIAEIDSATTKYTDKMTGVHAQDPDICYLILANKNDNSLQSLSNIACVTKESKIYMPNAFNPISDIEINRVFKPTYSFAGSNFTMEIYNRNGSKIYETNDIDEGWDGTIAGKLVPPGTYRYYIHAVDKKGKTITKEGSLTIIMR